MPGITPKLPDGVFKSKMPNQLRPGDMLYAKTTGRFALIISILETSSGFVEVLTLMMGNVSREGGIKRMAFNGSTPLDYVIPSQDVENGRSA